MILHEIDDLGVEIYEHRDTHIYTSPFGNCQNCSVAYFEDNNCYTEEDILKFFMAIYKQVSKPLCILDIRFEKYKKLEKLFRNNDMIHAEMEYQNTTGNSMVIIILKIDHLTKDNIKYNE
jgi:hypothetical protein